MLVAIPLKAFRLGPRQVVVCQLPDGNANRFLHQKLSLYSQGKLAGSIQIDGVSTASDIAANTFDFSYSGDEILPEQLIAPAVITDAERADVELGTIVGLTASDSGR